MLLEQPVGMPSLDARKRQKTAKLKKKKNHPQKDFILKKKKGREQFSYPKLSFPDVPGISLLFSSLIKIF